RASRFQSSSIRGMATASGGGETREQSQSTVASLRTLQTPLANLPLFSNRGRNRCRITAKQSGQLRDRRVRIPPAHLGPFHLGVAEVDSGPLNRDDPTGNELRDRVGLRRGARQARVTPAGAVAGG